MASLFNPLRAGAARPDPGASLPSVREFDGGADDLGRVVAIGRAHAAQRVNAVHRAVRPEHAIDRVEPPALVDCAVEGAAVLVAVIGMKGIEELLEAERGIGRHAVQGTEMIRSDQRRRRDVEPPKARLRSRPMGHALSFSCNSLPATPSCRRLLRCETAAPLSPLWFAISEP